MAGKKDESDVAFEVKTAYYLGNFQQCISAVQKVKVRAKILLLTLASVIHTFVSHIHLGQSGVEEGARNIHVSRVHRAEALRRGSRRHSWKRVAGTTGITSVRDVFVRRAEQVSPLYLSQPTLCCIFAKFTTKLRNLLFS